MAERRPLRWRWSASDIADGGIANMGASLLVVFNGLRLRGHDAAARSLSLGSWRQAPAEGTKRCRFWQNASSHFRLQQPSAGWREKS